MKKVNALGKVEKINYLTPPSHIVLVSTMSKAGVANVAPFGMFMIASSKPPMVAVGISPKSDSYRNIIDTKEFVISIPKEVILDKVYKAGDKVAPIVNEFEYTGLTPYEAVDIKPYRIAECCVNIDCKLNWMQEAGNHYVICGNVLDADIDEEILRGNHNSAELRTSLDCVYHITGSKFALGHKLIKDVK